MDFLSLLSFVFKGSVMTASRNGSIFRGSKWTAVVVPFAINVERYAALEALVMAPADIVFFAMDKACILVPRSWRSLKCLGST